MESKVITGSVWSGVHVEPKVISGSVWSGIPRAFARTRSQGAFPKHIGDFCGIVAPVISAMGPGAWAGLEFAHV